MQTETATLLVNADGKTLVCDYFRNVASAEKARVKLAGKYAASYFVLPGRIVTAYEMFA
jgi:hypothetical protein